MILPTLVTNDHLTFAAIVLPSDLLSAPPKAVRCQPCHVGGPGVEGDVVILTPIDDLFCDVVNIGNKIPPVGTIVIVHTAENGQFFTCY